MRTERKRRKVFELIAQSLEKGLLDPLDNSAPDDVGNEDGLPTFWRKLGLFMSCGVNLLKALRLIADNFEGHPLHSVFEAMACIVRQGGKLSNALDAFPRLFPGAVQSIVSLAEKKLRLPDVAPGIAEDLDEGIFPAGAIEATHPAEFRDEKARCIARARFWREFGRLLQCSSTPSQALLTSAWVSKDKELVNAAGEIARSLQKEPRKPLSSLLLSETFTETEREDIKHGEKEGKLNAATIELSRRLLQAKSIPGLDPVSDAIFFERLCVSLTSEFTETDIVYLEELDCYQGRWNFLHWKHSHSRSRS